jgi:hypothetical protein
MRRQLFVLRCLLATFAGLVNRQQANAIDYHYPGVGSMVRIAAVLTVVDRPPAASCFRPASGSCDVTVPSFGEPAGTTYALQVVRMMPALTPTNALEVRLE